MGMQERSRRRVPSVEGLEERRLLTTSSTIRQRVQALDARHEYDQFVTGVQSVELQSGATPAEYLALRDDARAISEAASTTKAPAVANSKAASASLQDRPVDP